MVGRIVSDVAGPCATRNAAFVLIGLIAWWGLTVAGSVILVAVALAAAVEVLSTIRQVKPSGARPTPRPAAPAPQAG